MEQADKLFYESLLLRERQSLMNTLRKMDDHGIGSPDEFSARELSSYDNHPGELGTEVFNLGMNQNLKANELYNVREIERALKKLYKGNYGVCEFCGKDINKERLEARPQARLCIECQNSRDIQLDGLMRGRPVEEETLAAPFDKGYPDEADDREYEGLDQWNDLLKYGSASSPQDMGNGYKDYKEFYTNEIDRQGIVDEMDDVTNEEYKDQLPD